SYWINTSHDGSKFICGNQDNGTFLYNGSSWLHIGSGDGMVCFFDPGDNNTSYHSYQNGLGLGRITNGAANGGEQAGDQTNLISQTTTGQVAAWVHQSVLHPVDRHVLYTAYQDVFKSEDQGATWTNVSSGNVNANKKEILRISKADPDFLVVGDVYDAQRYYKSTDGGSTWSQITSLNGVWIGDFVLDPNDVNHMYYCKHGEVFESTNQGTSWTNISAGLPWVGVRDMAYQDGPSGGLYLAMNLGVYWRAHADASWTLYTNNDVPNVTVSAIEVVPALDKVRIGTMQRGLWESDLFNNYDGCYQASVPTVTSAVCAGTVTLTSTAAPGGYSYQWYKDAQPMTGETNQTLDVTVNGRYVVVFKNGNCLSPGSFPKNIDITAIGNLPTVGSSCAALDFDGTDDAVTISQAAALDMDDDFTIEFWMKNATSTSAYKDILLKGNAYGITTTNSNLNFVTWGDDASFGGALRSDDAWHHYAFTAAGGNSRKLYVDGVLEATNTDSYTTNVSGNNVVLGDSWNNPMDMTLDELRIWNDTRTAAEIADNYNQSMTCFGDDLVLYLAFEEGTANGNNTALTALTDNSVYGNAVSLDNFSKTGTSSNWVGGNSRSWYPDTDNDGWGDEGSAVTSCIQPANTIERGGDCDDTDINIHPYADEVCGNSDDDDCDGNTDTMVNKALNFDGSNDRVSISNPFPHQTNVTMEAWFKTSVSSGMIMGWEGTNSAVIGVNGSGTLFYFENGGGYNFGASVIDGQWHHLAAVRTATQMIVYLDGNVTGTLPFTNTLTTSVFTIGSYNNGGNPFTGDIDEVRIWSAALTAQQIQDRKDIRLDGNETNLERYYHFDHGKPAQTNTWLEALKDYTGNNGDGELRNFSLAGAASNWVNSWAYPSLYVDADNDGFGGVSPWSCGSMTNVVNNNLDCDDTDININPYADEICANSTDEDCDGNTDIMINKALEFDGSDDRVNVTNAFLHNTPYTLEAWVKTTTSNTQIINFGGGGHSVQFNVSGAGLAGYGESNGTWAGWHGGPSIVDGQWHHVAAVRTPTNVTVYVDGNYGWSNNISYALSTNTFTIGGFSGGGGNFDGTMDEVRVWNTALTQTQIQDRMNIRLDGNEANLQRYYHFDHGKPGQNNVGIDLLKDASATGADGNVNNFALNGATSNWVASWAYPSLYTDNDNDGVGSTSPWSCGTMYDLVTSNADCDDTDADISPNLSDLEDGTDNNCNSLTNENNALHFDGVDD
ncbi:MAG: LamG-like jellyroll fold domain-containing protein, partial [Flavobacteriales bacterium]